MRAICIAFIVVFVVGVAHAQKAKENVWQQLSRIAYTKQYDELLGFKVDMPVFSDEIKALNGKEIEVKGYIIPVEGYKSHTEFIFSAFPYNMCFFCGGAGPETVMEVYANEPIEYQTGSIIIRGRLELNDTDINQLMYILHDVNLIRGGD